MIKKRSPREGRKFSGIGTIRKYFQYARIENNDQNIKIDINQNKWTITITPGQEILYGNHTRNDMIPQWVELIGEAMRNLFLEEK